MINKLFYTLNYIFLYDAEVICSILEMDAFLGMQ